MPSLSLNIGLNNGRKLPFAGAAAPSGIVAATAGDLIISFGYFNPATYTKLSNTNWTVYYGEEGAYHKLTWNIFSPLAWALDENNGQDFAATNPSTNPLIIPTSGWTYTIGGPSPSITITAA
jgi:hypothetical protein